MDIIINFFGFIPFGIAGYLFFASYGFSAKKAFFLVVISSLFTTLFIETAQTLIPTRTSQLFDVVHNGAGAFAGAVGVIFAVKLQKPLSHAMLKP